MYNKYKYVLTCRVMYHYLVDETLKSPQNSAGASCTKNILILYNSYDVTIIVIVLKRLTPNIF